MTDLVRTSAGVSLTVEFVEHLLATLPTADPELVVNTRNDLVDVDARLRRNDKDALLIARRAARVTEWHMAQRWPVNPDGVNRVDDRPPLTGVKGTDYVLWQRIYAVGRRDIDWLLIEDHPDHLSQQHVIEHGACTDPMGDEWYTPGWLFDALGLRFDLDVCAPIERTHVATPADRFLTVLDDGLAEPWDGLVWCNPPYSNPTPWAERMIEHDNGVLLSHVPINGLWCLRAWNGCGALRLLQGMEFVRPSGALQRPGYWLQLVAFGARATDAVMAMTSRLDADVAERFRPSRAWT